MYKINVFIGLCIYTETHSKKLNLNTIYDVDVQNTFQMNWLFN